MAWILSLAFLLSSGEIIGEFGHVQIIHHMDAEVIEIRIRDELGDKSTTFALDPSRPANWADFLRTMLQADEDLRRYYESIPRSSI